MPDNATDLLSKAIGACIAQRQSSTTKAEDAGHSYRMACPNCEANITFADDDLPNWRTDESAGSTDGDDDTEQDPDDDSPDSDDEPKHRASALAKRILNAARQKPN